MGLVNSTMRSTTGWAVAAFHGRNSVLLQDHSHSSEVIATEVVHRSTVILEGTSACRRTGLHQATGENDKLQCHVLRDLAWQSMILMTHDALPYTTTTTRIAWAGWDVISIVKQLVLMVIATSRASVPHHGMSTDALEECAMVTTTSSTDA